MRDVDQYAVLFLEPKLFRPSHQHVCVSVGVCGSLD